MARRQRITDCYPGDAGAWDVANRAIACRTPNAVTGHVSDRKHGSDSPASSAHSVAWEINLALRQSYDSVGTETPAFCIFLVCYLGAAA